MTKNQIIELLRDWEFVNPELVSDGYGQFPNGYKLTKSNLESFEKKIDEYLSSKNPQVRFSERQFNYYFEVGTEVTIDGETNSPSGGITDFYPNNLKQYVDKKGIVVEVHKDLHAFGQGTSYSMTVRFGDDIINQIPALYIKEYKDE